MLCCSFNFRDDKCNGNALPTGYDGMVATTTTSSGFFYSFSESVESTTDAYKQNSDNVRMADASDRFNISDLPGVKTEKTPQPGG